jgi:hypothetical protein
VRGVNRGVAHGKGAHVREMYGKGKRRKECLQEREGSEWGGVCVGVHGREVHRRIAHGKEVYGM